MPFGGLATAAIGAGGSVLGGILGKGAADKAAKQQAASQQKVIDFTTGAVNTGKQDIASGVSGVKDATTAGQGDIAGGVAAGTGTLQDTIKSILSQYSPYTSAGGTAVGSLQDLASPSGPLSKQFSFEPKDLSTDPGYAFTLSEGQKAIQRSAAAQGGLFSTGTLKSLAGYTTGSANQYFNDAYQRALNTFQTNRAGTLAQIGTLQGLAGLGAGATAGGASATGTLGGQAANLQYGGGTAAAGLGLQGAGLALGGQEASADLGLKGAQVVGGALTNQGNAQAAGTVGSTNAWLNALQGGTNALTGYLALRNPTGSSPYFPTGNLYDLIGSGPVAPPPTVH